MMRNANNSGQRPQILVALFDLDDTLYDCLHQRVEVTHRHAAAAAHEIMREKGIHASVDEILAVRIKAFLQAPQLKHIDAEVAKAFGAEQWAVEISKAAHHAYFACPVGELTLFPETLPTLRHLRRTGVQNFVVSYGLPEIQRAKVQSLGLDREESVSAIYYADRGKKLTKETIFNEILGQSKIAPEKFLVVGDRPSAEILAGNRQGMHTVRVRAGEFAILEPQSAEEEADFEIKNISELLSLPYQWGSAG